MLSPLDLADPAAVADTFRAAAEANLESPDRRGSVEHLPSQGRLVVSGDLHDHTLNFRRICKFARLQKSPENHLILHEVIHGESRVNDMDLSIRTLARCAQLKAAFPRQVHVLLSNHELAQMNGEAIMKEGVSVTEAYDTGIDYLYNQQADNVRDSANAYIRSMLLAVRTAHGVMVSHSLPAPRYIETFDKTVLDRLPTDDDLATKGSAYLMVWGRHQNEKITEELANAWDVRAFIVGHQPSEMGFDTLAQNTLIITSEHGHGQVLALDLSKPYSRDDLLDQLHPLAAVRV